MCTSYLVSCVTGLLMTSVQPFFLFFIKHLWTNPWDFKPCSVPSHSSQQPPTCWCDLLRGNVISQRQQCDELAALSQGKALKCFMMQTEAIIIIKQMWLIGFGCFYSIRGQVWGRERLGHIFQVFDITAPLCDPISF